MLKKIKNKLIFKKIGKNPVALIGASGWGSNYLRALSLSTSFDIKLVMDVNEKVLENISKKYKYSTTTSLEGVLKSDIKNVFVVLPNHLHYSFAKKLLEAGKNVYIEKPLANSSQEAKELQSIASKNQCILYTCHNQSYEGYMQKIKEIVLSNTMGKIFDIECERSLPTAFGMKKDDWRNDKIKCPYGPLMQLGIHFIDFFNNIFGGFEVEQSSLKNYIANNDDYFSGVVSCGGVLCKLKFSYVSSNTMKIYINGEKYNISFDGSELTKIYHDGSKENIKYLQTNSLEYSVNEFFEMIEQKNVESNTHRAINSIESIERIGNF